jgi:Ca2+:H+ antiporter
VIALTALKAGQYALVKASIAGAIVTNALFMLGGALLLGGLRHHVQTFNAGAARLQATLLFAATIALLVPSLITAGERVPEGPALLTLSAGLAVLLIAVYGLGLLFSLGTHRTELAALAPETGHAESWPLSLGLGVLAVVTVCVALVSEIFVGSVEVAGETLGMSPAFVGFIVVALVGAAAEMTTAFSAAMRDRLDLAIGIALGSSVQIALFVAPVLVLLSHVIGPAPMGLQFWPGAVVMMLVAALTTRFVASGGRSAWFLGVLLLTVYVIFALTLYVVPPAEV